MWDLPKRAPSYATEAGSHELAQPDLRKEGSSLEAVPVMTQPVEVYREAQMPRFLIIQLLALEKEDGGRWQRGSGWMAKIQDSLRTSQNEEAMN